MVLVVVTRWEWIETKNSGVLNPALNGLSQNVEIEFGATK